MTRLSLFTILVFIFGILVVFRAEAADVAGESSFDLLSNDNNVPHSQPSRVDFLGPREVVDNSVQCTTCSIAMEAVLHAVKNNETLHEIEAVLRKVCFGSKMCDDLIEKFTTYLPYIAILAEAQDFNAKDMCSMVNYCEVDCCKTDNIPEQVHLGLNGHGRASVSWTTRKPVCSEIQIEGHTVNRITGQRVTLYSETLQGYERTYTAAGWRGWLHFVDDMGPSTMIHQTANGDAVTHRYRVGCPTTNSWSQWFDMRSGVKSRTIAVVGDMGIVKSEVNLKRFSQHLDEFDLFIIVGDQSYADGNQRKWDEFLRMFEPIFARRPLLTITGNHEVGIIGLPFLNITGYEQRFLLPNIDMTKIPVDQGSRWYYSYNYGPIHFIGMDTESTLDLPLIIDEQIAFVERDLQKVNRTETPFVIVKTHRPFYCSGDVGACDSKQAGYMLGKVEHLFEKYHVDLVLSGHRHNMERCGPVLYGENTTEDKAPVYIVNGAGGNRENFQGFGKPHSSSKFRMTGQVGYALLSWDETADQITWRQFTSADDVLVDSVSIKRKNL